MRAPSCLLPPVAVLSLLMTLAGCGGNATPRPSGTTPTPTPAPAPNPAPTPAASVSPTTYTAGILNGVSSSTTPDIGKLTVNSGKVTYQFSGWVPNLTFPIDFCSYPVNSPAACFSMNVTGTTDASGAASGTFQFPKSGTFAGWFRFNPSAPSLSSGFTPAFTGGLEYQAAILAIPVQPPLIMQTFGTGSVTVTNGAIHIQVNGAPANLTYNVFESFAAEGEDQIGVLMTDAKGNGSVDLASKQARGLIVLRRADTGGDVYSGFSVP